MHRSLTYLSLDIRRATLISGLVLLLTACGGSGSGGETAAPSPPVATALGDVTFTYSASPALGERTNLALSSDQTLGNITWEVVEKPSGAALSLTPTSDQKSVDFTVTSPGRYVIEARSAGNGSTKRTGFVVLPTFPFDAAKVEGLSDVSNIESVIGKIRNQSWVRSASLSEAALRALVAQYSQLAPIGYEGDLGLLVQFDDSDPIAPDRLAKLAFAPGVSGVFPRIHQGSDVQRTTALPVNFSASHFSDGGDNWHLERINAIEAWDYTVGDSSVFIGIIDEWRLAGRISSHPEMLGRVETEMKGHTAFNDHGFSVAGALAANAYDGTGITGINWRSKLIARTNLPGLFWSMKLLADGQPAPNVINASMALSGHLPQSFDPSSGPISTNRLREVLEVSREFRTLAKNRPNTLFVLAAGNGIGNGSCNATGTVCGVDAKYENGAVHLDDTGALSKLSNVITVGAMFSGDVLAPSSAHGETIDIAAPTSYKSIIGEGIDTPAGYTAVPSDFDYGVGASFGGTSAAAPVVAGVASLVYSIFPGFTAAEVKEILLTSASTASPAVIERWSHWDLDVASGKYRPKLKAPLNPSIPVINAAAAVRLAKQRLDEKVRAAVELPDPFDARARIVFSSMDTDLVVNGVDYGASASTDGGSNWVDLPGASVLGSSLSVPLGASGNIYRLTATISLTRRSTGEKSTVRRVETFGVARVNVIAQDAGTLAPLGGVSVSFEDGWGNRLTGTQVTGIDGRILAYTKPVSYRVRGTSAGYRDAVSAPFVGTAGATELRLKLSPLSAGPAGSFSGLVSDVAGRPIIGATVRISGRTQTGGYYRSATTDALGRYELADVALTGNDGSPIYGFDFEASAPGYAVTAKRAMLVTGAVYPLNFMLVPGVSPPLPPPPAIGPDLSVQGINIAPTGVTTGGPTTVSFRIVNNGDAAAAASRVAVRFNQSATSSAGSNADQLDVPALAAGAGFDLTTTVAAPTSVGTYRIWILGDNTRSAGQTATAEADDIVLAATTLTVTQAVASTPDLVLQNISFAPTSVAAGAQIAVSFTLANVGAAAAAPSAAVIRINQSTTSAGPINNLQTVAMPNLASGTSTAGSAMVTVPSVPGSYYVWVIADNDRSAGQSAAAEANDIVLASGSLNVVSAPTSGGDLVPRLVSFFPITVVGGGRMSVSFRVTNAGLAPTSPSTAAIRINQVAQSPIGADLALVNVPALAPGAEASFTAPVLVPVVPGAHRVWMVVDEGRTAGQTGAALSNDSIVAAVTIDVIDGASGGPDLVVQDFSFDPANVTAGGWVVATFSVANIGSGTSKSSYAQLEISPTTASPSNSGYTLVSVPLIGAGGKAVLSAGMRAPTAVGSYTLWALADSTGRAGQTNTAAFANDLAKASASLTVADRVVSIANPTEGVYGGALVGSVSRAFRMLILENGEFWTIYGASSSGNIQAYGFLQGNVTSSNGALVSSDIRDFGVFPVATGSATGSYDAAAGTISGSAQFSSGAVTFNGSPITNLAYEYTQPASLSAITGTWGMTASTGDRFALNVSASGQFTATSQAGCSFAGQVAPRPSGKNVYDVSLMFGASPCLLPSQSMRGVALLTRQSDGRVQMSFAGMNSSRSAGLSASGYR